MYGYFFVFFFSSRRRHTRLQGDWSSDVCSSDLFTCESLGSLVVQDMTALKRKRGDSDGDAARRGGVASRVASEGRQGVRAFAGRGGDPGEGVRRRGDWEERAEGRKLRSQRDAHDYVDSAHLEP